MTQTKQLAQEMVEHHSHDIGAAHFVMGGFDVGFYIGWCLFAFLGFAVEKFITFSNRKNNKKFSFKYFLEDNSYDLIFGFLIMLLAGRFHGDLLSLFPVSWADKVNIMFLALAFGYSYTAIFQILRKGAKLGKFLKSSKHETLD